MGCLMFRTHYQVLRDTIRIMQACERRSQRESDGFKERRLALEHELAALEEHHRMSPPESD